MTANQKRYQIQQERIKQAEEERKRVRELLEKFKERNLFSEKNIKLEEDVKVEF